MSSADSPFYTSAWGSGAFEMHVYAATNRLQQGMAGHIAIVAAVQNRVEVDPNRFAVGSDRLTTVLISDFTREPVEGEYVIAVQPDEDDGDLTAGAMVVQIDKLHGIAYLDVAWDQFVPTASDCGFPTPAVVGSGPGLFIAGAGLQSFRSCNRASDVSEPSVLVPN
jgi:hypothetical protein